MIGESKSLLFHRTSNRCNKISTLAVVVGTSNEKSILSMSLNTTPKPTTVCDTTINAP